jgi:riboflavin synthase alpha subunit
LHHPPSGSGPSIGQVSPDINLETDIIARYVEQLALPLLEERDRA